MENNNWQNRTQLLLGENAVRTFEKTHLFAVGTGGVGGIAIEMLVRAGIGEITIADGDLVDHTNRNRQIPALVSTTGRAKTEVMKERLLDINPDLKIHLVTKYLTAEDMEEILSARHFDIVLDAIDSVAPKNALLAGCVRRNIPVVSSMGSGAKLDPEKIQCADISKTKVCGLARAVRTGLAKMGIRHGVTAVFSTEEPVRQSIAASGEGPNKKSVTGTVSFMPAAFGCHCASAVIRLLINKE